MKAKILLAGLLFMVALCLFYFPGHAQDSVTVDSALRDTASRILDPGTAAAATAAAPATSLTQILTVTLPSILGSLLVMLGAIQFVLKRIPTQQSVRIQGTLGKLADFITAFQKDMNLFGGTHKILIILVISAALALPAGAQTSVTPTDSLSTGWAVNLNVLPVGFTFDGVYHLGAGTALSYQKKDYNYATKVTTVVRSYNFIYVPLVTGQPITSVRNFLMIGATYGFDHNLIQVGPFYYPPGLKLQNQFGLMGIIKVL
jgi:hypothetical protein